MEESALNKRTQATETVVTEQPTRVKRPRSATMLKLQWLAERVRKCEQIRKAVAEGNYKVDSRSVARSIVNLQFEPPETN